ncbi:MAG: hypothetical protein ACLFRQ_02515 [Desulfonatronovibrio sp.]
MKKIFLLLVLSLVLFSCAPKKPVSDPPDEAVVAVAGFTQPAHQWQMINNHIVAGKDRVDEDIIAKLNADLAGFTSQSKYTIVGPRLLEQCEKLVSHGTDPGSAFHYWVQVGRCVPADYILVPFLFDWQERKGGELGVERPAKVTLELNLINVEELIMDRFLFDERQLSLSENILGAGQFFKRGAKWISARELAREGLQQGVRELGL